MDNKFEKSLRLKAAQLEKELAGKNRELEIEAAQERVRARAMAMQSSGELADLVAVLFNELSKLHITFTRCMIWLMEDDTSSAEVWMADPIADKAFSSRMKFLDIAYHKAFVKAWRERKQQWVYELKGEEKRVLNDLVFSMPGTANTPEEIKQAMIASEGVTLSFSFNNFGGLQVDGDEALSSDNLEILSRFSKVFDQTYTRFSDLQKSEAQAREAQIELALERVRARTMAMQHSEELAETAFILFQQFKELGENPDQATIGIINEEEHVIEYWVTMYGSQINKVFKFSIDEPNVTHKIYKGWKAKKKSLVIDLSGKALLDFATYRQSMGGAKLNKGEKRRVINVAFFSKGIINVQSNEARSEESIRLLERFAAVFEGTYTRFLDLKKAEAQVREARIEATLEKVRSRSLAMHKSGELHEVVILLAEKLKELNVEMEGAVIFLPVDDKRGRGITMWAAMAAQMYAPPLFVPYQHSLLTFIPEAWEKDTEYVAKSWPYDEKTDFWKWAFEHSDFQYVPEGRKNQILAGTGYALSTAFAKHSALAIPSHTGQVLSDEDAAILKRFTVVFDQAYIRFLDLQKAEAQAREAQIELALERVRARTMAMYHSEELAETSSVLFEQLSELGSEPARISIGIMDEEKGLVNFWATDQEGDQINISFIAPLSEKTTISKMYAGWQAKLKSLIIELEGRELAEWVHFCREEMGIIIRDELLQKRRVHTVGYFSQGWINYTTHTPPSSETTQILERFATMFSYTYTRFLDLQKAEAQAHEAQIELSLERVRASAMAMHKTDQLLDAAELLYKELTSLGVKSMAITYAIMAADEKSAAYYSINPVDGKLNPVPFDLSHTETEVMRVILSGWKNQEVFSKLVLDEEATLKHQTYIAGIVQAHFVKNNFDLPFSVEVFLEISPKKAIIYAFHFAQGYIFIIGSEHLTKSQEEMVIRFTKVFEMTYRRFLDLKQAEEQARESQIQLALERVRARTIAMQKSGELHEVIQLVFDQLQHLNFKIDNANFTLNYQETDDLDLWLAVAGAQYPTKIYVPYFKHPMFDRFNKAKRKGGLFTDTLSKEEKDSFFGHFFKYVPKVLSERKALAFSHPGFARSVVFMKNTVLTIINYQGIPFSEAENNTLLRFGQAFDQTYTRFKDLEQAEAQTREAQIQLGLERVRARAMAMQSSDELAELVDIVFKELNRFDFGLTHCAIAIADAGSAGITLWQANAEPDQPPISFYRKPIDHPYPNAAYKEWKKRTPKWAYHLQGAEKKAMHDYYERSQDTINVPHAVKAGMASFDSIVLSHSFNNFGYLRTDTVNPLSEENLEIVYRFAKVFDLCYTRFTDIKQAEAQAKESQIQLALERVRARTMAMQRSEELAETATVLFQQLYSLDVTPERVFIGVPDDRNRTIGLWGTEQGGTRMSTRFEAHADGAYSMSQIFEGWKDKKTDMTVFLSGEHLDEHINYVANIMHMPVRMELVQDHRILYCTYFSKGMFVVVTPDVQSEKTLSVLKRFAAVFDQTYTRFLDLQKAEAQAREGQIQLGLERVRARTMAMQKSDELAETASVLFQQLLNLGISSERTFIGIPNDDTRKFELWGTEQGGHQMSTRFEYEADATYAFSEIYKAWQEKRSELTVTLKGKHLEEHVNYVRNVLHMPLLAELVQEQRILYNAFFSKGLLMIVTPEIQPEETLNILKRFAAVFDQTYTRFLDLQKAEAQAREGQIQLGLERVRAKAMAMQTSEELNELIGTVFSELTKLDFVLTRCLIMIFDPETKASRWWMANSEAPAEPMNYLVQNHKNPAYDSYLKAWKERDLKWKYALKGKVKRDWDDFLFVDTELAQLPGPVIEGMKAPEQVLLSASFNNFGCLTLVTLEPLSDEHSDIMLRFAKVFDMCYTRFNDLKQAEIQAREGQIQLGLERVRAAAMAMHDSAGVSDATALVFTELYKLGIDTIRCGVCIINGAAKEIEVWSASQLEGKVNRGVGKLDMTAHPLWMYLLNAWKAQTPSFTYELKGLELADYYHIIRTASGYHAPDNKAMYNPAAGVEDEVQYCNCYIFKEGCLFTFTHQPFSQENSQVQEKFAAVFGLTYRRYLDLQRAEAQAREAQIEASLEKVRSKAMAMHNSDDLASAASVVFTELRKLGITAIRCGVGLFSKEAPRSQLYSATISNDSEALALVGWVNMAGHPVLEKIYNGWLNQEDYFPVLNGKELRAFYKKISPGMNMSSIPGAGSDEKQYGHFLYFNEGALNTWAERPYSEPELKILDRFKSIISLTFRRYLDLKKAEAQVREAQIEAALERVRSKTMAMHSSSDVADTVAVMFDELVKLGVEKMMRCGIGILTRGSPQMELWTAKASENDKPELIIGHFDTNIHPMLKNIYDAWHKHDPSFSYLLAGDDMVNYFETINNLPDYPIKYDISKLPSQQYISDFFFAEGLLFAFTSQPLSDEISSVCKRFAGVFGQTYRRYLDLQRAEAQAREAQIEAALERVRSKTMAMHNSADVGETVILMFNELIKLGVDKIARCGIAIPDNTGLIELWTARLSKDEKEEIIIGHIDTAIHPMLELLYDAWKSKQAHFEYILEGDDLTNYITALNNYRGYPIKYDMGAWGPKQYHNDFFFHEGMVFAFTSQPLSAEISAVFNRFAGVFGQTYRRYLDLQKAEAQAREAQIEAALERVRSKAMAMRSSEDLNATANTVFVELRKLGVDLVRCGVGLLEKQSHISIIHAATDSAEGASLELLGNLHMDAHPILVGIYKHWRQNEDYFPVLEGQSLKDYYKRLQEDGIPVPELKSDEKQLGYFFPFADGVLYAWSGKQESEMTIKTLKRFTSVIGLTYTRYIELQNAELNTKEAVKQASLDRVRAEIASMRKRNDLERITPLIWNELTILGIPFIRCGVFIMDEEEKLIHTFLSTPDGKAIGAFHVPFNTSGNFEKMVDSWRHSVPYIDHWKEEAFSQFADTLVKQGAIASKAQYMRTLPHEGIHLNFLPFLQGMLYVGNSSPLAEDNISLIQAVADAFSTAYARYEDFNKLEAAKQQVDNTLTQLKATQTKLIQSEKMASLGELTAGIAHEIQNPLNFVNNFSEVSAELIDEMDEELDKGDIEEAKAIAKDIKDNLEKIRHHGGRADGIVKGMLQHSRTGGGEKQPTNINALADEFMRLSYHGLRAKDKVFNAELVTHFDPDLPKISVIGQDIGRVLLNLFNNAFYAVNQKKKAVNGDYKPEVAVTTLTENGQVAIKVKDNGVGMPDHIREKIMQPFFTTKPTGEGTGLGLSLTYDMVVKGHGGSIQVNSVEGEGSEFIIQLPIG